MKDSAAHPRYRDRFGHGARPGHDSVVKDRQGVFALILSPQRDKILLTYPAFAPESPEFPGGGVDPGETPDQACAREIYEETGCRVSEAEIAPTRIYVQHVHFLAHDKGEFWNYTQEFRLLRPTAGVYNRLYFDGLCDNPEGGRAQWLGLDDVGAVLPRFHHYHRPALSALLHIP